MLFIHWKMCLLTFEMCVHVQPTESTRSIQYGECLNFICAHSMFDVIVIRKTSCCFGLFFFSSSFIFIHSIHSLFKQLQYITNEIHVTCTLHTIYKPNIHSVLLIFTLYSSSFSFYYPLRFPIVVIYLFSYFDFRSNSTTKALDIAFNWNEIIIIICYVVFVCLYAIPTSSISILLVISELNPKLFLFILLHLTQWPLFSFTYGRSCNKILFALALSSRRGKTFVICRILSICCIINSIKKLNLFLLVIFVLFLCFDTNNQNEMTYFHFVSLFAWCE